PAGVQIALSPPLPRRLAHDRVLRLPGVQLYRFAFPRARGQSLRRSPASDVGRAGDNVLARHRRRQRAAPGRRTLVKEAQWHGDEAKRISAIRQGPAEIFTGSVRIDPLIQITAPARDGGTTVTFEPGVRSAWHTHPLVKCS